MYILTIEYYVGQQHYQHTINALHQTKHKGIVTIGRDANSCDLALQDITNTVSRKHITIYFDSQHSCLKLRNLTANRTQPNVAIVDGKPITNQSIEIKKGSHIQLGQMFLTIKQIQILTQKPLQEKIYGVKCGHGHHVSLDYLGDFCPHCGLSLQSSKTILLK